MPNPYPGNVILGRRIRYKQVNIPAKKLRFEMNVQIVQSWNPSRAVSVRRPGCFLPEKRMLCDWKQEWNTFLLPLCTV